MNFETLNYGGITFEVPIDLSDEGFEISPSPVSWAVNPHSPIFTDMFVLFDLKKISTIRRPIRVGFVNKRCFWYKEIRVLDMVIKEPGDITYTIPDEMEDFLPAIQLAIDYEQAINLRVKKYYCYLTIDQGEIPENNVQRQPGWHVDGFQEHYSPTDRTFPEHSYMVSNCYPTEFWPHQLTDVEFFDPTKINFNARLDRLALTNIWRPKPYQMVLSDAYSIHRSPVIPKNGWLPYLGRTFFRMTFSLRRFDRLGNTINPMFEQNWDMVKRSIPSLSS